MTEHNINSVDCWCNPVYLLPCDECEDGCWKCEDGLTELTYEEAADPDVTVIVVHRDEAAWAIIGRST